MHLSHLLFPFFLFLLAFGMQNETTDICEDLKKRNYEKADQKLDAYFYVNPPVPKGLKVNEQEFRAVDAFIGRLEKEPCIDSVFYTAGRGLIMKSEPAKVNLTVMLQTPEGEKRDLQMRLLLTNPIRIERISEKD